MRKILFFIFLVSPCINKAQVADSSKRLVHMQGAVNFRDIGGYPTADGHHVKWNKVYRSAAINKLTDADVQVLAEKHIYTVVDLRGTQEAKMAQDRLVPNTDYILCPAGSENTMNWMKSLSGLTSGDSLMGAYYGNTDSIALRYKPFFEKLINLKDNNALLFHCSAGKDRTGIGAALLLYALGVPKQIIMDDYLASNIYRAAENEKMIKMMVQAMQVNEQVATDMASVKASYLQATFDAIDKKYGSIDNFLKGPLQLDDTKIIILKKKFLE